MGRGHRAAAGLQRRPIALCFNSAVLLVKNPVPYIQDWMVSHRFNRTFPERSQWHRGIRVYFGGVQSDVFCSGKQRAHAALIWKDPGLAFSLACWRRQVWLLIWADAGLEISSGHPQIQEVGPVGFMVERLPCSISLLQPVGVATYPASQHKRNEVKDGESHASPSTLGNTAEGDSSDQLMEC